MKSRQRIPVLRHPPHGFNVPCFVVSLERAIERRMLVRAEFDRAGIAFEFVDAIDAGNVHATVISPSVGIPISAGDVACTMSHGLALRKVLDRELPRAIIFEDDVCLSDRFANLALAAIAYPAIRWDVLKLGGKGKIEIRRRAVVRADIGEIEIVSPVIPSLFCEAYAVTAAGAKKLLPFTHPAHDAYDLLMQQVWKTKAAVAEVLPRLAWQRGMESMIDRAHHNPAINSAVRWRRRLHKLRRSIWKRWEV